MAKVIGLKFKSTPKIYYFEAGNENYEENDSVIVETTRGIELGKLQMLPTELSNDKITQPLKPIIRIADEKDIEQWNKLLEKQPETLRIVEEKIAKSELSMKVVDAEYTFDASKLIIYFMSDGRVDFRDLVKDLATTFRVRIELRQIGARDECRMIGGLAPCGRACCCSDHLTNLAHVTIKMAKNQNLSLSPSKISGLCGRLMCCLQYENETYACINKKMPKIGSEVEIADGRIGKVTAINQIKESVSVKIPEEDTFIYLDVPLTEIKKKGKGSVQDEINGDEQLDEELSNLMKD